VGARECGAERPEYGANTLSLRFNFVKANESNVQLRIWGGGIYQPDSEEIGGYDFYSLCDELGILAWSEFIFSDTLYPINDFFLQSIEPEVRQNVRRINKHPSNVQWAGGNEIEGIVTGVNNSMANGTIYLVRFRLCPLYSVLKIYPE
jgi:hypothetical protein